MPNPAYDPEMQDRWDAGQEGYRKGGIRDCRDSFLVGYRNFKGIKETRDTGNER